MDTKLFSVLLVDDQKLFRDGLQLILKQYYPDIDIRHAGNGPDALEILKKEHYHLVILDIGMPEMNGMEVARQIIKYFRDSRVLVVTQYNGEAMIRQLLETRIHGLLFKSSSGLEIKKAIDNVLEGKQHLPPGVKPLSKEAEQDADPDSPESTPLVFNKREAEILLELKMGRSSKEIAERLNLKENTVNSYRAEMLQKTKTKNVTELILFAYENGLLG